MPDKIENPFFLVSNDDGPESPLVGYFLSRLKHLSLNPRLLPVLPFEERSWTGQAITRGQEIQAIPSNIGDVSGFLLRGTPADCAAVGIEHLAGSKPDYFFSGINLGTNAGLGFYFNSGTVGAARQAFLHEIPGAAFSVAVPEHIFSAWSSREVSILEENSNHFLAQAELAAEIAGRLIQSRAWELADFFSVNLPWEVRKASKWIITELERQQYGKLFVETRKHHFSLRPAPSILLSHPESHTGISPGDLSTVSKGNVSITPRFYTSKHDIHASVDQLRSRLSK